ncbi:hypothetical protein Zmor_007308 [Zophobas morio]|uniref:Uncharacterized protein n=1 Tax=Zophobas morio TaxID=2755281 RepID=A0AA38IZ55_9CUCU|nr:hypothetical protein Zmor_008628 [Zophobas morio]KAJ3662996.1 hypothetical protein Zmor_007308 [Zophobas morio]
MVKANRALSNTLVGRRTTNVVPLAELPRLVRATLWIPGPPVDAEVVLHRLQGQNQWGRVKKWLVFHHEVKPETASLDNLFVFGFGMDAAKIIRGERAGSTTCCPPST